ncbi:C2CD2 protein, partial [Centropus bengalensis]|nr:C2CD2 protein [Centropus bengalensis]
VVSCNVVGDSVTFVVTVSHPSPTAAGGQSYTVKLSPLHLQLQLYMKDKGEDVKVEWLLINANETNFEIQSRVQEGEAAGTCAISESLRDVLKNLFSSVSPSVVLSTRPTDIKEVQNVQNTNLPQGTSPPKPPRAHELKLLVKNIAVNLTDHGAAGSTNLACIVQLNDPMQKFSSSVAKNVANPFWKEEFIFELSAKSKALQLQIVEDGKLDRPFSAKVTVSLDLFRKQPCGQQNFVLNSSASESSLEPGSRLGSISAEFSFIEPNELKTWQTSSPVAATKIEKDRTVMPCGTVVTTVTAVKTKPRLEGRSSPLSTDSPVKTPVKVKVIEKDFSAQAVHSHGAPVSKTLSSSDTELLVLNGTDPVAEAAIRQLSESAKQKLKSPRKKSTIIISGVSKTSLSQDSEAAMMMNYAAAMDSSCKEADPRTVEEAVPKVTSDEKLSLGEIVADTDPQESAHKAWGLENGNEQWDSNTLLDQTCEEISGSSLSVSETGSMKKSKGGILKKSAKLFFRRRHHQKDPGMSQSHNDLVYLQQPLSEEARKKGGTLSRILNRKLLSKNRSKSKLNGASAEPYL